MPRRLHPTPLLLLAVFSLGWAARPASAQITYTYQTYGERGVPASGATNYLVNWPISQAECDANEPIRMVVTNAPYDATGTTRLEWDLWQGGTGSAGANCQTATNRRPVTGSVAVCSARSSWSGGGQITSSMPTLTFRPQELFADGCDGASQGAYVFYVLAVSARGDTTTDVAATHYFTFSVALDLQPPSAPTVSDAAGDRQVVVSWTNNTSETLTGARVYVDVDGDCEGSSVLVAGAPAPPGLAPAVTAGGGAPTSASVDAARLGLEIGQAVPVAVTVLDQAHNESVLSNVACLTRVPVSGFWDEFCTQQGETDAASCRERYSGCSVGHAAERATPWALWLVLGALFARAARRRGGAR